MLSRSLNIIRWRPVSIAASMTACWTGPALALQTPFLTASCLACRMADAIRQGVLASNHRGLQAVAETLLKPCLASVAQGLAAAAPPQPQPGGRHSLPQGVAPAAALRGRAWLLLGLLRLQLAAPPAGTDPAGKYAVKQAQAERRLQEEVLPEMEVGPRNSGRHCPQTGSHWHLQELWQVDVWLTGWYTCGCARTAYDFRLRTGRPAAQAGPFATARGHRFCDCRSAPMPLLDWSMF